MSPRLRSFYALLLSTCLLLACGDDLSSEDHLNNANEYIKQGKIAPAIIELKNAVRKDDSNASARATLGSLYFDRADYEDADKELSRALSAGMDPSVVVPVLAQT